MAGPLGWQKEQPGWDKEFLSGTGMVARDMYKRGKRVERAAKRQVGKDTRNLERHIDTDVRAGVLGPVATVGVRVEPGIGYAYWHHEGTKPHLIAARKPGEHLRFRGRGGAQIFEMVVHHPGTKANRYLSDNLPLAVI
jgi:hypothetical protein